MTQRLALASLVAAVALALTVGSAGAAGIGIGIGAFGGTSTPIDQEDAKTGAQFGVRLPVNLLKLLTVEPYYANTSLADGEVTIDGATQSIDGFTVNAFGVNAILGSLGLPGFGFYPYVGISTSQLTREGSEDIQEVGYNAGLGVGLALGHGLSVQGRAEVNVIDTAEKTRTFGNVNVGLSYNLFKLGS